MADRALTPKGKYFAQVTKIVFGKTIGKGSDQVEVYLMVFLKFDGKDWVNVEAFESIIYLSLVGGAREISERELEKLEFNFDAKNPKCGDKAMGEGVEVECVHETYNGKTKDKWKLAGGGQPMQEDDLDRLNAEWSMRRNKPVGRPTSPPKPRNTLQEETDKELAKGIPA